MVSFDRCHELLSDDALDSVARAAGFPSGIGRLSLTSDTVLEAFHDRLNKNAAPAIIDLGCGRGFLGRWLAQRAPDVRYSGIDFSSVAIAHARKLLPAAEFFVGDYRIFAKGHFDAAVILDSLFADRIAPDLALRIRSFVRDGGFVFIGATTLSDEHAAAFLTNVDAFQKIGCDVEYRDWTSQVELDTLSGASAWVSASWPQEVRETFVTEALDLMHAVEKRTFTYATITAYVR